jgi:two-component system LytT family response regulator
MESQNYNILMDRKLSALIVDDEESARKLLNKLLEETLFFYDIRDVSSVSVANNLLMDFEPDIIFLDIKMPGKDGITFIQEFTKNNCNTGIIFVTAYDHYAIKAIKNRAFDYLLKPVNRKELRQSIVRFLDQREEKKVNLHFESTTGDPDRITRVKINTRTGTIFINPDHILYCKAEGNYTTICTGEKQYLCSMNLGKLEELIRGKAFLRVGRSYIINYEYITMLDRKESTVTLVRDGESARVKLPRQHLKDLDII